MRKTVYWIEGDGIGPDVWKSARPVIDEAIRLSYGDGRGFDWKELLAGEKALKETGTLLPDETLAALLRRPSSPSRAPSVRRWARVSAASTSPCARPSTSTPASGPSATLKASSHRSSIPSAWT